jgi:hypothetical protein
MLGKLPLFHAYLNGFLGRDVTTEDFAVIYIREYCGVASRSQLLPGTLAEEKFLKLYDDFVRWRDADKFVETPSAEGCHVPRLPPSA